MAAPQPYQYLPVARNKSGRYYFHFCERVCVWVGEGGEGWHFEEKRTRNARSPFDNAVDVDNVVWLLMKTSTASYSQRPHCICISIFQ